MLLHGPVEAENLLHLLNQGRRRFFGVKRPARQRVHRHKGQAGHDKEDRDKPEQAADDDLNHEDRFGGRVGDG